VPLLATWGGLDLAEDPLYRRPWFLSPCLCWPILPRSLPIKFSPGRPEQAILISGILIALAAAPRLATDTAPTFTSAIFPQGIQDTFTITTSGDPVAKITSRGKLPGVVKFVDNGDGTATLSGRPACVLSAHRWLNSASRTHWRIRDCMTVTER